MLDSHASKNTYKLYKRGDKVFVRVGKKRSIDKKLPGDKGNSSKAV